MNIFNYLFRNFFFLKEKKSCSKTYSWQKPTFQFLQQYLIIYSKKYIFGKKKLYFFLRLQTYFWGKKKLFYQKKHQNSINYSRLNQPKVYEECLVLHLSLRPLNQEIIFLVQLKNGQLHSHIPSPWIVRLVTTVSYNNYHLAIAYSEAEPLWITIGGVPFTGYLYQVNQDFVLRKHILTRLKDIERQSGRHKLIKKKILILT